LSKAIGWRRDRRCYRRLLKRITESPIFGTWFHMAELDLVSEITDIEAIAQGPGIRDLSRLNRVGSREGRSCLNHGCGMIGPPVRCTDC
jgi:hypothetical protein